MAADSSELSITDFSLYSIGIIATRLHKEGIFKAFLEDILEGTGVNRICLAFSDLKQIPEVCKKFRLDFDDAYQYVAAKGNDLVFVSFDADFDRTDLKRMTPAELIS